LFYSGQFRGVLGSQEWTLRDYPYERLRLRACTNRRVTHPLERRTRMLDHAGSPLSFPNRSSILRARPATIHHRARLATVPCPFALQGDEPPLGLPSHRIPDRVVFEKLVQVLVFGCASSGESPTRGTRLPPSDADETSGSIYGVMDELNEMAREFYDRVVGLELSEVAVDCCITKAPCGGEKAGRSPVDRESGE
jgi:hypothetical protein